MLANKKMSSLLVALLFSTAAWGGLGGIAVRSNLGEVLRADIDLTGSAEDEIVRVGLASPDTFRDLQVDYSPALTSLRFALAYRSNGKPYIRVLSVQPISDPYLRFVVEAKTASGRSIREYTVLLDPLEYPNKADAIERSAKAIAAAEPARLKPATPSAVRIPLPAPAAPAPASPPDFIVVKRGQTLAQVGRIARADGATLRQTMAALVLANPSAFVNGDPATLRTGARLRVPSAATARALKSARVAEVLDGFAAAPAKPVQKAAQPLMPAPAAPATSTAQPVLKLEQPETASAPVSAQDAQLKAAQQKIQELEDKLKSMQMAASAASAMAAIPAESASAPVPAPAASAPVQKPAAEQPASAPEEEGPGLMSQVMDYLPLIAGGSAAVLLGAAALLFMRRRKRGTKAATEAAGASILGAGTVGRVAGVDEAGSNTFLADFTRTGMNGVDAGEVDPIAEAEVYLAYGRDQQAEDILKDALTKDPTRHEVRLKLMEIYASRQDKAALEAQARELHAAVDGKGSLWSRAAAMGMSVDPTNPLYAGEASPAAPVAAATPVAAAAAMSIDLDSELMGEPEPLPQEAFIEPESIAIADDDPLRNALFGEPAVAQPAPEPDLDLESLLAQPAPEPEPPAEEAPEDKHMLDFDFNLDTPEPAAAAPAAQPESVDDAFDFDMSTLDSLGSPQASEPAAPSLDGMSLSDDPLSTKLDLARVYLDMGDKEGAREVLEELAAEAQGSLKSEAETLLASL